MGSVQSSRKGSSRRGRADAAGITSWALNTDTGARQKSKRERAQGSTGERRALAAAGRCSRGKGEGISVVRVMREAKERKPEMGKLGHRGWCLAK